MFIKKNMIKAESKCIPFNLIKKLYISYVKTYEYTPNEDSSRIPEFMKVRAILEFYDKKIKYFFQILSSDDNEAKISFLIEKPENSSDYKLISKSINSAIKIEKSESNIKVIIFFFEDYVIDFYNVVVPYNPSNDPTEKGLKVIVQRKIGGEINNQIMTNLNVLNNNKNIKIPAIYILGQTLIDSSDIGNIIFTVIDKYYYKDFINDEFIDNNIICKIELIPIVKIKKTVFEKCCPKICSVFLDTKNKNNSTLYNKVKNIYNTKKIIVIFPIFYKNILLYSMLRYILCRILYGYFDIKFLLRKKIRILYMI